MEKTHYGSCDRSNESDNQDYWSDAICGLDVGESPMTDNRKEVSCKRCLAKIKKHNDAVFEKIKQDKGMSNSTFGGCGMGTF